MFWFALQNVEHRESWASWGALRNSQAALVIFSTELSKKLDIWYKNPPLPVDLSIAPHHGHISVTPGSLTPDRNDELSPDSHQSMSMYSPDLRSLQAKFAPASAEQRSSR